MSRIAEAEKLQREIERLKEEIAGCKALLARMKKGGPGDTPDARREQIISLEGKRVELEETLREEMSKYRRLSGGNDPSDR